MDKTPNIENQYKMVSEFISKTGASPIDALSCLKTWGWDIKRAITDYNDTTYTADFIDDEDDSTTTKEDFAKLPPIPSPRNIKENKIINNATTTTTTTTVATTTPALIKQNSIDMTDCKKLYRGISRATDNVSIVSKARSEIANDIYKSLKKSNDQPTSFVSSVVIIPSITALSSDSNSTNGDGGGPILAGTTTTAISNFSSIDTPDSTFILPNIYNYPDDFRAFIEKDLIETSTLNALEQAQRLNWWVDTNICRKLWPLATTGDGNCLLHAASLGMWGFHDRKLTLRTALYSVLSDSKFKDALRRRWRFQQTQLNKRAGFVYSESEWQKEWDDIITMASPEPRRTLQQQQQQQQQQYNTSPLSSSSTSTSASTSNYDNNFGQSSSSSSAAVYESLEEIHILALAHVLRRTIIVISDTVLRDLHGEAMAPITFGGIYLPFEIEPKDCNRGPLLLAYDMAHFSSLVPMENDSDYPPALVPLTDFENILLPIQFCIDPGENFDWKSYDGNEENWSLTEREHIALLKEYLDIVYVTINRSPEEEIYCEDLDDVDFEKKFSESEIIIPTLVDYAIVNNFGEETNNNNNNNSTGGNGFGTNSSNNNNNNNGKSKASRQLHSVAKQFGSIGKNMSRKLKKNIGSIAKLGSSSSNGSGGSNKSLQKKNSFTLGSSNGGGSTGSGNVTSSTSPSPYACSRILCARLRLRRHEYQEEMIRNYIECAQNRFIEAEKCKIEKAAAAATTGGKQSSAIANTNVIGGTKDDLLMNSNRKLESLSINDNDSNHQQSRNNLSSSCSSASITPTALNNYSFCINSGCNELATSDTSYLCHYCFEKQKEQENLQYFNSSPRYDTGNSKFYTQADLNSHNNIRKLPSLRRLNDLDQTLYLSNSTFYNDNNLPTYDEVERSNKESHQYPSSSSTSASYNISSKMKQPFSNNLEEIPQSTGSDVDKIREPETYDSSRLIVTGISSPTSAVITTTPAGSVVNIIPITRQCKTLGCPFYGNSSTNFLCSKCQKLNTNTNIKSISSTAIRNNQQDIDYRSHHNHHHSSFQTNPIFITSQPTVVTPLYKSESKITSDI